MRRRWAILAVSCMALIGAGILVRIDHKKSSTREAGGRVPRPRGAGRCEVSVRTGRDVLLRQGTSQRLCPGCTLVPQICRAGERQRPVLDRLHVLRWEGTAAGLFGRGTLVPKSCRTR